EVPPGGPVRLAGAAAHRPVDGHLHQQRIAPAAPQPGDMIVPVSMRLGKTAVLLVVATYTIYQIGQIDLLTRFLTGLGVAGLAASLAAQDALKSFFGTLLLIGERVFKIGDKIVVNGHEGVVEQVGFRSTRLRTSDNSLLTIPNSTIATASIDNKGARPAPAKAA